MAPPPPHATGNPLIPDMSASSTAPTETTTSRDPPPAIMFNEKGMSAFPSPPKFDTKLEERQYLKERLALAFRIFAKFEFDEGVAGHITLRDPIEPETFWLNPFGMPFAHMTASALIRVDGDGKIIDGGPVRLLNTAAYAIHHAVHTARPDVLCAAHSHSIHGRTFATLGRPLDITTQDSCAFYDDHTVYDSFNGVVLESVEGDNIAKALGLRKAIILQNHGLLTVASTIEGCVFWFVSMEKCCRTQLMADAAAAGRGGKTIKVDDKDAEYTYKTVGTEGAGWFSGLPLFEVMARECNDEHKL